MVKLPLNSACHCNRLQVALFIMFFAGYLGSKPVKAEKTAYLSSDIQGWAVTFKAPALETVEEKSRASYYRYFGKNTQGLFLSLHVRPIFAQTISPQICQDIILNTANGLPDIVDVKSVKITKGHIPESHYNAKISFRARQYVVPNIHYYFTANGYCADLHLGAMPNYDQKNEVSFKEVAQTIKKSLEVVVGAEARFRGVPVFP